MRRRCRRSRFRATGILLSKLYYSSTQHTRARCYFAYNVMTVYYVCTVRMFYGQKKKTMTYLRLMIICRIILFIKFRNSNLRKCHILLKDETLTLLFMQRSQYYIFTRIETMHCVLAPDNYHAKHLLMFYALFIRTRTSYC